MTAYAFPASGVAVRKTSTLFATAVAIVPATNTQIGPYFSLFVTVTTAGTLVICPIGQTSVVTIALPIGAWLIPIAIQGVDATSTIVGSIIGLG